MKSFVFVTASGNGREHKATITESDVRAIEAALQRDDPMIAIRIDDELVTYPIQYDDIDGTLLGLHCPPTS